MAIRAILIKRDTVYQNKPLNYNQQFKCFSTLVLTGLVKTSLLFFNSVLHFVDNSSWKHVTRTILLTQLEIQNNPSSIFLVI